MSFSPDIDEIGFRHANIYAWSDYTADNPPYPGYVVSIGASGGPGSMADAMLAAGEGDIRTIDFTKQPLYFPTIELLAGPGGAYLVTMDPMLSHLVVYTATILNKTPRITSSGFFDWDSGFGFGINSVLHKYKSSFGGSEFDGILSPRAGGATGLPGDVTLSIFGHNCEDAIEYIENDINESPFVTICVTREMAASVSKAFDPFDPLSADLISAGAGIVADMQQMLFKTDVVLLSPSVTDPQIYNSDQTWATPNVPLPPGHPQLTMAAYPKPADPVPVSDGSFTGDLRLYRCSHFVSHFDGDYSNVKNDLKDRFKNMSTVDSHFLRYVEQKTDRYAEVLGATFKTPKGTRTKRQASPKALRGNYTTFEYDDTIAIASESTPASPELSMTTVSSVGSSGGSY